MSSAAIELNAGRSLKQRAERLWEIRRLHRAGAIDVNGMRTALATLSADEHPRIASLALLTAFEISADLSGAPIR